MERIVTQAKRLLEAIEKFPDLPHNLLSTAADDDRRQATEVILLWWNSEIDCAICRRNHTNAL